MTVTRYDEATTPIDKFSIDPITGYLHVKNVPITIEGVRRYRKGNGQTLQEAKTPEELFSPATVGILHVCGGIAILGFLKKS